MNICHIRHVLHPTLKVGNVIHNSIYIASALKYTRRNQGEHQISSRFKDTSNIRCIYLVYTRPLGKKTSETSAPKMKRKLKVGISLVSTIAFQGGGYILYTFPESLHIKWIHLVCSWASSFRHHKVEHNMFVATQIRLPLGYTIGRKACVISCW